MTRWIATIGMTVLGGMAAADEVQLRWQPSSALWKGLTPKGEVVAAGPAPAWSGIGKPPVEPAARLAAPTKAASQLPKPRELPEAIVEPGGPMLPPLPAPKPATIIPVKHEFASSPGK